MGIEEETLAWNDEEWNDHADEDTSWYTGFWADEDPVEHEEQEGDTYEFHEDVDGYDVIALNALVELIAR